MRYKQKKHKEEKLYLSRICFCLDYLRKKQIISETTKMTLIKGALKYM